MAKILFVIWTLKVTVSLDRTIFESENLALIQQDFEPWTSRISRSFNNSANRACEIIYQISRQIAEVDELNDAQ